ncbi:sigma factor-like helix-turn-helix DNA-binding protein [Cryobacterium melibiosiphilum]|uniref:sigma factor-like helix-turn-helix DNA-binding protein n=1 Tax=Cryobacterium melibiosiphilum TaxID=995039 RepID=UPI003608DD64
MDQEIIRLVHWDGLSLKEVSQHLSPPSGTIRSRYHRARRRLREELDDAAHKPSNQPLP